MAKSERPTLVDAALKQLDDSNDRAVAIVGATLVEAALEDAIVSRLLPMSSNHRKALFESDSSYTFAGKIDLGLSLGLYGKETKLDLHRIKKIRNEFAHNIERDFSHSRIAPICALLMDRRTGKPLTPKDLEGAPKKLVEYVTVGREMRFRFLMAVFSFAAGLARESAEHPWQPPQPTELPD